MELSKIVPMCVYLILVGDLLCPCSSLIECNVLLKSAAEAGADLGIT